MQLIRSISQLPCQGDDLANDKFRHAAGVAEGGVEDGDAVLGRILEVDLVRADAEAADDDDVLGFAQDSGCEFSFGPDADYVDVSGMGHSGNQ